VQAVGGRPLPALVCEPLQQTAAHLFTTIGWTLGRAALPSGSDDGWREVAEAMGVEADRLRRLRQVHGAAVVIAEQDRHPLPDGDIIVSMQVDRVIAVQAADCVPLLMADTRTGAVAAAHAGWRGLAARVPGETVAAMARAFGSRPEDLLAAIGPAIGPCCYEVGEDVRQAMSRAFAGCDTASWFTAAPTSGKWMFDTWASARAQLEAAGVPAGQVFDAGLCTASHPDAFPSYRRDGARAGRIAAAIKSRARRP
jgi:purine-nucleoside/S-methyl-5'-thioadenosine phosphorylase / adenosine deaminase